MKKEITHKLCNGPCGKRKPVGAFYEMSKGDRTMLSHWSSFCKDCECAKVRHRNAVTHKADRARENRRYREKHPEVVAAHAAVYRALRRGTLVRPTICQGGCGRTAEDSVIEMHHEDYSRPLYVWWLCKERCHPRADKARRERVKAERRAERAERKG